MSLIQLHPEIPLNLIVIVTLDRELYGKVFNIQNFHSKLNTIIKKKSMSLWDETPLL
jgi:hypothetical protein